MSVFNSAITVVYEMHLLYQEEIQFFTNCSITHKLKLGW